MEPERKVVSVLFVDLVGFTPLSERLDAEDVATIQNAYFEAVRTVVSRHGGVVEKYIGDAVMAVFGVPRVREDDAARACAAGLALAGAVDAITNGLGLEEGELQIRVAVNSGQVVQAAEPSPDGALITGDVVNVAARLQGEALPGRVLAGPVTALLAADRVELEPGFAVTVKGKSKPLEVAHVRALRPQRSREQAMGSLQAPLIGRDHELAELEAAPAPGLLALVAPPGSGKSRLLHELALRRPVLEAVVRPDALRPFDAVAQLAAAALAGSDRSAEQRLREAGATPARAGVLASELAALLDAGRQPTAGEADRERRFADWIELLSALRPGAAWLLDDVHWASADLRAFLLAAGGPDGRSLVVAATRPSLLTDHPGWRERARVLELAPLAPEPAARLARSLVGDAIPAALGERIAAASDGNPLFIEELLRSWAGSGLLVESTDGWQLTAEPDAIEVPAGIQAVYVGQLDDLPDDLRTFARRAAVAGRRFPVGALAALELTAPDDALDGMQRRGLIAGPGADPVLGQTYGFRHALLREAAYGTLARAERARRHAALAAWFGERERGHGETAELAGRHYEAALREAPALGREVAPGVSRDAARTEAAGWYERAAEAASAATALETAAGLLDRALELTAPDETAVQARRLRLLGVSLTAAGDTNDAASVLEQALELHTQEPPDRVEYAAAVAAMCRVRRQQIRFREAADLAAAALGRIGDGQDAASGWLLMEQAEAQVAETDDERGWAPTVERALAIAQAVGDRELELRALSGLAEEPAAFARVRQLAAELGRPEAQSQAIRTGAFVSRMQGHQVGPGELDPAVELADAYGLHEERAWLDYVRSELCLQDGDLPAALAAALSGVERGEAHAYTRAIARSWFVALPILAAAPGDSGQAQRARGFFDGLEQSGLPTSPYVRIMLPAAWLNMAVAGAADVDPPEPSSERLESFRLVYGEPSWTRAVETVVGAWLGVGRLDAVEAAMGHLRQAVDDPHAVPLARATYHLLCGRLALAQGRTQAVCEESDLALAAAQAARAPLWEQAARDLLSG